MRKMHMTLPWIRRTAGIRAENARLRACLEQLASAGAVPAGPIDCRGRGTLITSTAAGKEMLAVVGDEGEATESWHAAIAWAASLPESTSAALGHAPLPAGLRAIARRDASGLAVIVSTAISHADQRAAVRDLARASRPRGVAGIAVAGAVAGHAALAHPVRAALTSLTVVGATTMAIVLTPSTLPDVSGGGGAGPTPPTVIVPHARHQRRRLQRRPDPPVMLGVPNPA